MTKSDLIRMALIKYGPMRRNAIVKIVSPKGVLGYDVDAFVTHALKRGEVTAEGVKGVRVFAYTDEAAQRFRERVGDAVDLESTQAEPALFTSTLLDVQRAIVAELLRHVAPISIDQVIEAMPMGTDDHVVRALLKALSKAGMILHSLVCGVPQYVIAPAFRAESIGALNTYCAHRGATELPPAPKERSVPPAEAPSGPAPVATSSSPSPRMEAQAAPLSPAARAAAAAKTPPSFMECGQ